MENNIVNVYGYIRVSTEGQVKQGYSLAEQRAEIEKYCSSKSYNLIEIFKDEGISGAKANEDEMSIERDGLLDMLASLKENKIQYIVVLSTNRLWRSDLVKVLLHRELKKNNVDIRAIDRPNYSIYTQNPNEIFVNGMFELLDVYERLEIALKLKRGRLQKAKDGGYAGGGAPFGYECLRGGKIVCKCNRGKSGTKGVPVKTAYARYDIKKYIGVYESRRVQGQEGSGL